MNQVACCAIVTASYISGGSDSETQSRTTHINQASISEPCLAPHQLCIIESCRVTAVPDSLPPLTSSLRSPARATFFDAPLVQR